MAWLMAVIYDRFMKRMEDARVGAWRRELVGPLTGEVIEIGAGTGANLPCYGEGVRHLVLSEPDAHMRKRLVEKVAASGRKGVEVIEAGATELPAADGSIDAVVCTLVLCSVPDQAEVLREARRVLRPGGKLVFMEHVAHEGGRGLAWQRFWEPAWKRVAGNCHLTRRTAEAIAAAGFAFDPLVTEMVPEAWLITRPSIRGVAVRQ